MPRQKSNNAVGVKGRSGRKGYADELKLKKLGGLCVDWAIAQMSDQRSPFRKEIALKVLPNLYPKIVAGDEDNPLNVVVKGFNYVKPNG